MMATKLINGKRVELTASELQAFREEQSKRGSASSPEVDTERERRISETFTFDGVAYQLDRGSQAHIDSAGAAAKFAIISGAQAGDLRWHGGPSDFEWIATDNTKVPMDAQTMSAFADAAMRWVISHRVAARTIKDNPSIPDDYDHDSRWPQVAITPRKR